MYRIKIQDLKWWQFGLRKEYEKEMKRAHASWMKKYDRDIILNYYRKNKNRVIKNTLVKRKEVRLKLIKTLKTLTNHK